MIRRDFLASLGATAGSLSLAGCQSEPPPTSPTESTTATRPAQTPVQTPRRTNTSTPTGVVRRYGVEFDEVLDVVDDLGADPTGAEPIDELIDRYYRGGTLLEFPPGSYLVESTHTLDEGVDRWGMVGLGESHRDVEFVFPPGNRTARDPDNHYVLNVRSGRDHVLANLTMQQTTDRTTGVGLIFVLDDGLHIEDLEFAGYNPVSGRNPGACIIPIIDDARGVGTIRNFVCTGGGVEDTYPARKVGILCGTSHLGELRLVGHDIRNMGSNAHYTSHHRGCVRTEDCYFENNDNTNIRISGGLFGGHPTKDSWVRNCRVLVDTDNADHLRQGEAYEFVRGIKCDYGSDVVVEDTYVQYRSAPAAPYCIGVQFNHGLATFRNVGVHSDVAGIGPLFEAQPNGEPVLLERVSFTGTARAFYDTSAGVVFRGRDACVIRNSCIRLTGGRQNGLSFRDSDGCRVENVSIDVPGEPIVVEDAAPDVSRVTESGVCVSVPEGLWTGVTRRSPGGSIGL